MTEHQRKIVRFCSFSLIVFVFLPLRRTAKHGWNRQKILHLYIYHLLLLQKVVTYCIKINTNGIFIIVELDSMGKRSIRKRELGAKLSPHHLNRSVVIREAINSFRDIFCFTFVCTLRMRFIDGCEHQPPDSIFAYILKLISI